MAAEVCAAAGVEVKSPKAKRMIAERAEMTVRRACFAAWVMA
jgi:hypothetical protein